MNTLKSLLLAAAFAVVSPAAWAAAPVEPPKADLSAETALRAALEQSVRDFNKGDFEAYFRDFGARVTYNELLVERKRLMQINKELKSAFPNLSMRYDKIQLQSVGKDEMAARTVAEFSARTSDYEGSGMPATYRETGQVTALYQRSGTRWTTHQLAVAWNDSYIDIGASFGLMGFTSLPTLVGVAQPYKLRLFVGDESRDNAQTNYAHAMVPLKSVIDDAAAESVFASLKFGPIGHDGVTKTLRAPVAPGTYVHLLVVNKFLKMGEAEAPLGQKIYTRLVRVE